MDHHFFKANQTAAVYVANGLDERIQEAFELHLMSCLECVEDVEVWRAIKNQLPTALQTAEEVRLTRYSMSGWRMAASFLLVGFVGAAGGYYLSTLQGTALDDTGTAIFSLQPVTRGIGNCNTLPLAPETEIVAVRVPGVGAGQRVAAVDMEGRELSRDRYTATLQADGTWVVRLAATALQGRMVGLEARESPDESGMLLGCLTGEIAASR